MQTVMAPRSFLSRLAELCVAAAFMTIVAACGGGGGGGGEPIRTTTSVTVTSPTQSPKQGDTVQLTAVARDQLGDVMPGASATWSSSAPSVATVSATGLLQALTGGTAVVTATINGVAGSLSLTITPRITSSVTVTSPTLSPQVGEALQLAAVARDQFGEIISGTTAVWSSSDAGIATVSTTGLLQTLTTGTVVVTAMINGVAGSLSLTISPRMTASVTITSPTLSPKEGDTLQLTAVARDQFGNIIPGTIATWSSSDTGIATVSTTGLLQTLTTGTVAVMATINGVSGSQSLTITAIKVSVTFGAKAVVYDYSTDRCNDMDLPDQPARFVRAEDGTLVLFAGNSPRHYLNRGADFGSLKHDCSRPVFVSADRLAPESYENNEWLWSVYREGNRWHALIHNEFHDPVASTCQQSESLGYNPCWYNSITYAVSTDGARSFLKPSPPAHVVAPAPKAWAPPLTPVTSGWYVEGYMSPTNIVRGDDGFYYALVRMIPYPLSVAGQDTCAIRTDTLDDPASWRAWDGGGFNLRMTSPYVTGSAAQTCTLLKTDMASGHLVYNTYLGRYMQVAQAELWIEGRYVCGIFYSLSVDLIHWSKQQLLAEVKVWEGCETDPQRPGVLEAVMVGYSSIVDHADTTINFERAGRTPYLYYTRFNDGGLDRDLVRVPLTFTRLD